MADLTLKDLTAPVDDLMQFIPPASSAYKSYLFPGFYSAGQTPSTTPNPVMGDNAVAAPAAGEPSYVAPPEAPIQGPTMLSSLRSIDPRGPGTSVDERNANREKEIRDAGELTDPQEALKAGVLGASFLGPTGLASLAATTALNAAGVPPEYTDPLGALLGNASAPFDFRSNTNLRPGYDQAFTTALDSAHRQHLRGPQAGAYALDSAKAATDMNAAARPFGVHQNQSAPATPDVTSLNKQTGFQRPSAPAAPATGSGAIASTTVAPSAPSGFSPPAAVPAAPAAPVGRPSGYGAAGAVSPNNSYSGVMNSGNQSDLTNRDRGAGGSGASSGGGGAMGSNAGRRGFATGGEITDSGQAFRDSTASIGGAEQPTDPYSDPRYNPPAASVDPQGVVDGEPIMATPGEFMIQRDAAQQFDPQVLAALNDPAQASSINQLIETLLNGGEDPAAMNDTGDDSGVSDDNSGMGIAGQSASPIDPRGMNAVPRGGSMLRSLSRVA